MVQKTPKDEALGAIQRVVPGPMASASPGNFVYMLNPWALQAYDSPGIREALQESLVHTKV